MFEQFPKTRPALPKEIADIHLIHYKSNREGKTAASSLSQRMETWLHRQVAKDIDIVHSAKSTLEIGAGTLNQLNYEADVGPYDIVEPFKHLYENSPLLGRIRNIYADIREISGECSYNRITTIAAFEHMCDLPCVIAKSGMLLAQDGELRVAIPSDGTPFWTLGWKLTTGIEFRIKYGLDYGLLIKHEHVNTAKEIEELLKYCFQRVNCKVLGISRFLSLYQFYACKKPDIEKCQRLYKRFQSFPASGIPRRSDP